MRRRVRDTRRRTWFWLFIAFYSLALQAQTALVPGRASPGRVAGKNDASFSIRLNAGETVWVSVSQRVDLLMRVLPPPGPEAIFDAFELGPEPVTIEASSTG